MNLDIVIPSKNRIEKLTNCLNSIFHSARDLDNIKLHLYFTLPRDYEHFTCTFNGLNMPIHMMLDESYRVPEFWNGHLATMTGDAMMYLNDDVLLEEDTLKVVLDQFPKHFPDMDGVMGLRQANLPQDQAVEGAFGVIGRTYCKRFPNGQVWCPEYDRFYADFELWQYAKSINKFHFCIPARIQHLHPSTDRTLADDTHRDVRTHLSKDKFTFNQRKAQGLLWGKSFDLVVK